MLQKQTRCFLVIVSAVFMSLIFSSQARAGNCGGGTPCACGDTLKASRILSSADPIIGAVCPGDGLIMDTPNVTLDFNGNRINGSGNVNSVGVLIVADDVTIEDGRMDNFGTGIRTSGIRNGSTIRSMRPYNNKGDGVYLEGEDHELISSPARHNGNHGVTLIGNNNRITLGNNEYNGFHGYFLKGNGNDVDTNWASENAKKGPGSGIMVEGDGNTIQGNRMTKHNTHGIVVEGNENILISNFVTKQRRDGITVTGNDNSLMNNKAVETRGILVQGTGSPFDPEFPSKGNVVNSGVCIIYGVTGQGVCTKK